MPAKSRVPRVAPKPPASTATATATGMATSSSIVDQNSQTTPLFLPREGDHDPYDSENEMPPPPPPRPKISGSSPKASDFIEHPGMLRDQIEMLSDSEHCSDDDEPNYESDDDPVVREYDVYITSELAKSLYLFQYPVRPRQKPYTRVQNSCPLEARLKSKAGLVEVDVPVNVDVNFNEEKGRIWGDVLRKAQQAKESGFTGKPIGVRGGKRRKVKGQEDEDEDEDDVLFVDFNEAVKKGRVLNKQTLGSKVQPDEAKYMVGVFHSGMSLALNSSFPFSLI
jgi:DNA-directed RNA polymerase-3 subunit RPC5